MSKFRTLRTQYLRARLIESSWRRLRIFWPRHNLMKRFQQTERLHLLLNSSCKLWSLQTLYRNLSRSKKLIHQMEFH